MRIFVVALSLSLGPGSLIAQQLPIEGTWRIKLETQVSAAKPLTFNVGNGRYDCESCTPPIKAFTADGQDHPIQQPDFNSLNVAAVDAKSVRMIEKKNGKIVEERTLTVSDDGNTLSYQNKFTTPNGHDATNTGTFARTSPAPTGTQAISGSWMQKTINMDTALTYAVYKFNADGSLTYTDKVGNSYTAKLDGKDYPLSAGNESGFVSLHKIDDNTFEESYKDSSGKLTLVSRTTIAPDRRHASVTNESKETGAVYHFEAEKE
jgi:hypothetical protein